MNPWGDPRWWCWCCSALTAWYEDYLSNELTNGAPGITLDELKALPRRRDAKGTRYHKYAEPVTRTQNNPWLLEIKPDNLHKEACVTLRRA